MRGFEFAGLSTLEKAFLNFARQGGGSSQYSSGSCKSYGTLPHTMLSSPAKEKRTRGIRFHAESYSAALPMLSPVLGDIRSAWTYKKYHAELGLAHDVSVMPVSNRTRESALKLEFVKPR
jgi:hypothetical protein